MASAVAVLAFVLVGVGTGLACVGLVLPQWLEIRMAPEKGFETSSLTLGLWQLCNGSVCEHFLKLKGAFDDPVLVSLGIVEEWMRPVEALYCLGVFGGFLALIMGVMYLCNPLFRLCTPVSMIGLVLASSFVCLVAAGIVFGLKVSESALFRHVGDFSWSMYVGVAGAGCLLLALILYCEVLACTKNPKFERLEEEEIDEGTIKKKKEKNEANNL